MIIVKKFSKLSEIVTLRSRVKLIRVTKVVLRKINVTGEKTTSKKAPKEKRKTSGKPWWEQFTDKDKKVNF